MIYGGAKFWIPSPEVLFSLGFNWDNVRVVPDGSLLSIPDIPKDNTLLKEKNNPTVYVMDKGQRRRIISQQSFDAYHFSQENVRVVPDGSLSTIPLGQDLPALPNTLIPIH